MKRIMFVAVASVATIMLANSPLYGMKKIKKVAGKVREVTENFAGNSAELAEATKMLVEKAARYAENEAVVEGFKLLVDEESKQYFSLPSADNLLAGYLSSGPEDEIDQKLLGLCKTIENRTKRNDKDYSMLNNLGIVDSVIKQIDKRNKVVANETIDSAMPLVMNSIISGMLAGWALVDVDEWRAGQGTMFTLARFFLKLGISQLCGWKNNK